MVAEISILVVDDDADSRRVLEQTLVEAGLNPVLMASGELALEWLEHHVPTVVLLDLAVPALDGFTVLERMRQNPKFAETPVVVLTALESDQEISRVFASGADDYVHKPFRKAELVARIRGQMRVREFVDRLNQRERDQETVLELTQTLASTLDIRDILFTVVQRVAAFARVDRCSIVLFGESGNVGYVLATSDDEQLRDLPIDLAKYPEIREVLSTGRALVIHDGSEHPLLRVVRQDGPNIGFTSFALLPILHDHGAMGVLFLRSKGKSAFDDYDLSLITTLTNAMAIALRNARILQSLRDATEKSRSARAEAERRVQLFQRYADFFESAADGMVVIDREGRVLFANPRAREITGFSETELMARRFEEFLTPLERDRAGRLLRGFLDGIYPRGVDIAITDKSGDERTISVSFSSVLHEDNAVVFSFRDVTKERATAIELKQTKEFLESVIDSSVDGIVSAKPQGHGALVQSRGGPHLRLLPERRGGQDARRQVVPARWRSRHHAQDPGPARVGLRPARGSPRRHAERRWSAHPSASVGLARHRQWSSDWLGRHLHGHSRKAAHGGAAVDGPRRAAFARKTGDRRRIGGRRRARTQSAADLRDRLCRAPPAAFARSSAAVARRQCDRR